MKYTLKMLYYNKSYWCSLAQWTIISDTCHNTFPPSMNKNHWKWQCISEHIFHRPFPPCKSSTHIYCICKFVQRTKCVRYFPKHVNLAFLCPLTFVKTRWLLDLTMTVLIWSLTDIIDLVGIIFFPKLWDFPLFFYLTRNCGFETLIAKVLVDISSYFVKENNNNNNRIARPWVSASDILNI